MNTFTPTLENAQFRYLIETVDAAIAYSSAAASPSERDHETTGAGQDVVEIIGATATGDDKADHAALIQFLVVEKRLLEELCGDCADLDEVAS